MSIFSLVIKWLHRLKKRFGGGLMEEPPGIGEFALHFGSDSEFLKKITYWAQNYYFLWVARNWVINLRFVHPHNPG